MTVVMVVQLSVVSLGGRIKGNTAIIDKIYVFQCPGNSN